MHIYQISNIFRNFAFQCDEDITDRLNYHYTSCLLVLLSTLVTARQLVGHKIQCWVPATFTKPMESYAEDFCFVQSTYWVPVPEGVPHVLSMREERRFGYYQWVPFFLAVEACVVYAPAVAWKIFKSRAGLSIESLVHTACSCRMMDKAYRDSVVKMISVQVRESLIFTQEAEMKARHRHITNICAPTLGSSATVLFFVMKITYIANSLAHLALLDQFIGCDRIFYGWGVILNIARNGEVAKSSHFPKVTLCDFVIKVLGNTHRHTIQCVLTVNLFNEKIFVFLWLWLCCTGFASLFSLLHWLFISMSTRRRVAFIRRFLVGFDDHKKIDSSSLRRFVVKFLRQDGVFLIRMTCIHAGELVASEVTQELWKLFRTNNRSGGFAKFMTVEEEIFCRERNFRVV